MKWGQPFDDEIKQIENIDFSLKGLRNVRYLKLPFGHKWRLLNLAGIIGVLGTIILINDLKSYGTIKWMTQFIEGNEIVVYLLLIIFIFAFIGGAASMFLYWLSFIFYIRKYDKKVAIFACLGFGIPVLVILVFYNLDIFSWIRNYLHLSYFSAIVLFFCSIFCVISGIVYNIMIYMYFLTEKAAKVAPGEYKLDEVKGKNE